jgi:hypothetical protein
VRGSERPRRRLWRTPPPAKGRRRRMDTYRAGREARRRPHAAAGGLPGLQTCPARGRARPCAPALAALTRSLTHCALSAPKRVYSEPPTDSRTRTPGCAARSAWTASRSVAPSKAKLRPVFARLKLPFEYLQLGLAKDRMTTAVGCGRVAVEEGGRCGGVWRRAPGLPAALKRACAHARPPPARAAPHLLELPPTRQPLNERVPWQRYFAR